MSDNNKTVTFLVSDVSGAGGVAQGLQSVLDTGNSATQNISLTGNITVVGTITPTTLTASNGVGAAGQILSSTGTGLQWIASPSVSCCDLDSVMAVGNTTSRDLLITGNIDMSGIGKALKLSNGVDMTLAVGSSITTSDAINLGTTLNFGATTTLNDYSGATGSAGQILTINAAGTGVEWGTLPTASTPTIQQVLTAGNIATAVGISFVGASSTTFDSTANITSAGTNVWSGNNNFSATATAAGTAGVALTGTLYDGASVGTGAGSYKYRVRRCVGIYCRGNVSNCSNASYFFRYASYYQPYIRSCTGNIKCLCWRIKRWSRTSRRYSRHVPSGRWNVGRQRRRFF